MKTILLMGGSMGHADHVKNIESLSQIGTPFQFLVVCGNNKKMLYHVEQFAAHYQGSCRIYPYGFVHNVEVMMSASDCIVSKPGGLTVSEALAKNLPMLLSGTNLPRFPTNSFIFLRPVSIYEPRSRGAQC